MVSVPPYFRFLGAHGLGRNYSPSAITAIVPEMSACHSLFLPGYAIFRSIADYSAWIEKIAERVPKMFTQKTSKCIARLGPRPSRRSRTCRGGHRSAYGPTRCRAAAHQDQGS